MIEQSKNRFQTIPSFISDNLYEDYSLEAITEIRKKYLGGDLEKNKTLKDIIALTVLKDIKIEQVLDVVEEGLKLDKTKAKEVAIIILCRILYPIKDYFPGIEDEILKLGGEIPKEIPKRLNEQLLRREEEMEAMNEEEKREESERMKDVIVNMPIQDLVKNYPAVESQQIGSQPSIVVQGMEGVSMKPVIKFWIKDYLEKMGYHQHSNLDRVSYVYHDKNTKNMNEEERRQLGLVLKSLDEGIELPFSTKKGKIDFGMIEL
ncbi:MAG: hypothetical protein WA063_03145 [Minisyncoccia bacterium]